MKPKTVGYAPVNECQGDLHNLMSLLLCRVCYYEKKRTTCKKVAQGNGAAAVRKRRVSFIEVNGAERTQLKVTARLNNAAVSTKTRFYVRVRNITRTVNYRTRP